MLPWLGPSLWALQNVYLWNWDQIVMLSEKTIVLIMFKNEATHWLEKNNAGDGEYIQLKYETYTKANEGQCHYQHFKEIKPLQNDRKTRTKLQQYFIKQFS